MRQLSDFSDDRLKGACIHCGASLSDGRTSREHVPTRSLLDKPYPMNLPTFDVHPECNADFPWTKSTSLLFLHRCSRDRRNRIGYNSLRLLVL